MVQAIGLIVSMGFAALGVLCWFASVYYMVRTFACRKPGVPLFLNPWHRPFFNFYVPSDLEPEGIEAQNKYWACCWGFVLCVLLAMVVAFCGVQDLQDGRRHKSGRPFRSQSRQTISAPQLATPRQNPPFLETIQPSATLVSRRRPAMRSEQESRATEEADLLVRAKAGSQDAFESVLRPHLPMLFAYSRAICGDYHQAQDVVQETALIAYRNLNHLFPEADFASWLKAIARRQALAARRQLVKRNLFTEEALEAAYCDPTFEGVAPEREALSKCLDGLDTRAGQLVRRHYFEGQKLQQLSEAMSLNLNTVKTLLYRARLALQDCVRQRLQMGEA